MWERVKVIKVVDKRTGKIVGKGENAGNQHFLLFSLSFQKASLSVKTQDVLRINRQQNCRPEAKLKVSAQHALSMVQMVSFVFVDNKHCRKR